MRLARVEGNVVATRKHPSLEGWRLVVCQPINLEGEDDGTPIIAIDPHGSVMHQHLTVPSDGLAERRAVADNRSPARMLISGLSDDTPADAA